MTANPIDTQSAAANTFISSHEKADNGYGQNGSPQSPSLKPGEKKPAIANVSPKQTSVPGQRTEDSIAHRVKMSGDKAAEYAAHPSMAHRAVDAGSPGGEVPAAPVRRSK